MGARDPFNALAADFSGLSEGLFISKVAHKAVIEINEEGTEASAATAVIMMRRCAVLHQDPKEFNCNRPFIFFIHDNQYHEILFVGKYQNPN